jgi:hypothetical protein
MKRIIKVIAGILLLIAGAKMQLIGWNNQEIDYFDCFALLVIGSGFLMFGFMLILATIVYNK